MNYWLLALCLALTTNTYAQKGELKGSVSCNGSPVGYCTIYIEKLSAGTSTDEQGRYQIRNMPAGKYSLTAQCIGYRREQLNIVINSGETTVRNIALVTSDTSLDEVVITGVSKATQIKENPQAVESISARKIAETAADNTIDAIAKNAPGMQTVKTGPNVSKPFINGLGYNRVLTLYDGMRVETQQWGDEHGVPMDDYAIERAEVIKGPSSLMYGSDAIAGVLSLFPVICKDTDRLVHGRYISEYQTNNGLVGNSLSIMKGNPHLSWAIQLSERIAKNYTDPVDGRVYNTGFKMGNGSAYVGYRNKRGISHLKATFYDNRQGIPDGSRDSLTRQFTYQVYESPGENIFQSHQDDIKSRPVVPSEVLNSYRLSPLSQRIQDYRLYSDHSYQLGAGDIVASAGWEQNRRREYDHPTDPGLAGEYIVLNTVNYGLRYNAPSVFNIEPSLGINGMYQTNTNKNATDFPIPDYRLLDAGSYIYAKWKQKRWTIAGGVRYDHRTETGNQMFIKPDPATGFYQQVAMSDSAGAIHQFTPFRLRFAGISGSIGATYRINEHLSIKANIARGYRAPNITEIASNGLDPGAHIYYEGNLDFKPEFSLQEDMGLTGTYPDGAFSVSLFNNYIQNYIYEDQKVDANGNPVIIVPGNRTFQYQQTNAQLYGGDAMLNIHPRAYDAIHFDNIFSLVYGFNLNSKYRNAGTQGEYLPFLPPPRWLGNISYDLRFANKLVYLVNLKAETECNAAQNRYLGLYNTETATASYTLLNVSANFDIQYTPKHTLHFLAAVNNLLNTAYQSHLSRLQYFEYYTYSPNNHYGIYNMGRNICFKVIVPF